MKTFVRIFSRFIFLISAFAFFALDMYSLVLLAEKYGLISAIVAFVIVPFQIFVPFMVGTWLPMIVVLIIGLGAYAIAEE